MPNLDQSLSHWKWDCKYHVVFVPKYRRKAIYGEIRKGLGAIFHELARQTECRIVAGHLMGGSRAHVYRDTPEVCRCLRRRVSQGQERHRDCQALGRLTTNFNGENF